MKLILSSCDFRNENSKRVILENLPKPINECKLLFIPNEKATLDAIKSGKYHNRMTEFGFSKENVTVFNYYAPKDFCGLDIDVIYVSGGNTLKTLHRIRNSVFDKELVRYVKSGVTYIGGSAGAHIVTQDVSHVSTYDPAPEGMSDYHGLGLLDGILICHYSESRKELYDKLVSEGKKVYVLTDDESLVIDE
ncbi:MAG: Type 1 glutamine amidotransferase-like domain-containing protein [Clostridia bacterium]|nr:Type 1 glutamine amidotransferase-like domain-containing protein [Clostridia bacterium]